MIQLRKIISFDFHHIPKLSIGFNHLKFLDYILMVMTGWKMILLNVSYTCKQPKKTAYS